MEVDVYLPKRVVIYEDRSRQYVLKRSLKVISAVFERLDEYVKKRDTLGILKMLSDEFERKSFYLVASEWAKEEESVFEKIGFTMKLPGLREGEERYVIYVLMAYSKGFTVAPDMAHHPGDLERVIIFSYPSDGKRAYYYLNTAAHGFPSLFLGSLGVKGSLREALKGYCFYFKPGDHALGLMKKERTMIFRMFWDRLNMLLEKIGFKRILDVILDMLIGASAAVGFTLEQEMHKFYLLEHEEIRDKLGVNLDGFLNAVVELDRKIEEMKRGGVDSGLRRVLNKISDFLWRTPIKEISNEMESILREFSSVLDDEIVRGVREIQLYLDSSLKRVQDLKRESVMNPEKYLESRGIRELSNLSLMAKVTIPLGLEMLLGKPLYDWGYPEKAPLKDKIGRVLFTFSDIAYRLFQEAIMDLEVRVM